MTPEQEAEFLKQLEPAAVTTFNGHLDAQADASKAISLKRIADILEHFLIIKQSEKQQ